MIPMRSLPRFALAALFLVASIGALATEQPIRFEFGPWPAGTSPQEVGRRVAANFIPRPHVPQWEDVVIHYAEACTWYGALTFAGLSHDPALQAQLVRRFEPLFREEKNLLPDPDHVDWTVFAAVPLEIYIQNKDLRCLALGEWMAQNNGASPMAAASMRTPANTWRAASAGKRDSGSTTCS